MLKNLSRDPPTQSTRIEETELIPDPWDSPSLDIPHANSLPLNWHLPIEAHSLISAASVPGLPQLPSHKELASQILLWNWLKLKAGEVKGLIAQLMNALTLLVWLETTT
ncbi:hypothetical protein IQ238_03115 [Pleurocapsales cyanobacterium LEGE 06147]|nr:hypothetical protein [Pleurocapsales cyanobacterium LEGE 06147]